jgi:septal ring factor EnvC (AmiA/AmiB activator)
VIVRLLRTLTLAYVAVLVPTLATSLTAIWLYLRRIDRALSEASAALAKVRDETRPLGTHLQALQDAPPSQAERLARARTAIDRADKQLAGLASRSDAPEPTS